ncbi:MAG: hypothetical protein HOM90_09950 [Porticoccaceae bacterium]|mgnify:CR=1|jgi:hypothetical protein|nr:hypothetical protein [Porticoccaceae bacterium]MBT3799467.1 hypothetical protein [Porticoccaceae bacterium]MBT4164477.1 hypothetical protein [Porticoccaceae bacterium]MBT4211969.1 hypothetical protein [Porticoccaceae bacterium]MBT4590955.1 hypothetical protein [Porticoccaceae bacterium]
MVKSTDPGSTKSFSVTLLPPPPQADKINENESARIALKCLAWKKAWNQP